MKFIVKEDSPILGKNGEWIKAYYALSDGMRKLVAGDIIERNGIKLAVKSTRVPRNILYNNLSEVRLASNFNKPIQIVEVELSLITNDETEFIYSDNIHLQNWELYYPKIEEMMTPKTETLGDMKITHNLENNPIFKKEDKENEKLAEEIADKLMTTFKDLWAKVENDYTIRIVHKDGMFMAHLPHISGEVYCGLRGFLNIWGKDVPITYNGQEIPPEAYEAFFDYCLGLLKEGDDRERPTG